MFEFTCNESFIYPKKPYPTHFEVNALKPFHPSGVVALPLMLMTLFKLIVGPSSGLLSSKAVNFAPADGQSPPM